MVLHGGVVRVTLLWIHHVSDFHLISLLVLNVSLKLFRFDLFLRPPNILKLSTIQLILLADLFDSFMSLDHLLWLFLPILIFGFEFFEQKLLGLRCGGLLDFFEPISLQLFPLLLEILRDIRRKQLVICQLCL